MRLLGDFLRFWYDFVVGDDWRVAIGLALALGATAALAHEGIVAWWLPPIAVVSLLADSIRRGRPR